MKSYRLSTVMLALCAGLALSACGPPEILVHKTPTCGCCKLWVAHMQAHGFAVRVKDMDDLSAVRERLGVPEHAGSCHTAEVGGYFVEGHVPAEDVKRLLAAKPAARGLAVPGMPLGSPGMEQGDRRDPYDVLLVQSDGSTAVFARYGE